MSKKYGILNIDGVLPSKNKALAKSEASLSSGTLNRNLVPSEVSVPCGMALLTSAQLVTLDKERNEALMRNGRVELGGSADSIIKPLAKSLAASDYADARSYFETLCEMTDIFYALKNECRDAFKDDEVLFTMAYTFEKSGGSTRAVADMTAEDMCLILKENYE